MIVDYLVYADFSSGVYIFCFGLKISFLEKFAPKHWKCQFKMKLGT